MASDEPVSGVESGYSSGVGCVANREHIGSHKTNGGVKSSFGNVDMSHVYCNRGTNLSIFDRSWLKVPMDSTVTNLIELDSVLDQEVLLITSFLVRKMPHISSKMVALQKLNRALERLGNLKSSLSELDTRMDSNLQKLLDRLSKLCSEPDVAAEHLDSNFNFERCRVRVSWFVAEYLARRRLGKTAHNLARHEGIDSLIDLDLMEQWCNIINGLLRRDLGPAMKWALEHQGPLSRINSGFLAELKVQELFQKLIDGSLPIPVDNIGPYLDPGILKASPDATKLVLLSLFFNGGYLVHPCYDDMGDVLCSIQFNAAPNTFSHNCLVCQRFLYFYSGARWDLLVSEFETCIFKLYGIEPEPTLEKLLHAGFSALKSKRCPECANASCPACSPQWASYLESLPEMNKVTSTLICPITGEIMDYSNPPVASPDGYVFSKHAIDLLTTKQGDRLVVKCPKTSRAIPLESFKKIFII